MRASLTILLIGVVLSSCSTNKRETNNKSYVKIIVPAEAKNPDAYNKGAGAYYYAYFNLSTDSLFYIYPQFKKSDENDFSYIHMAYQGKMNNAKFRDTVWQLIRSLEWRPSGNIDSIPDGATYCGWEYIVEFRIKDTDSIKHYAITYGVSDTLNRFYDFFERLEHAAWDKYFAKPKPEDIDNELVSSMKRFGIYETLEVPYLFPSCDTGVDFSKLIGRWRSVGDNSLNTSKELFSVNTIRANGTFLFQQYKKGKLEDRVKGTYMIDAKAKKIFYRNAQGNKMTQTITQLTDSCLSGSELIEDNIYNIKWNRY